MAVERLATLTEEFRAELKSSPAKAIEFSDLRAARERGQESMLQVFSRVLGTWNGASDDHVEMRSVFLDSTSVSMVCCASSRVASKGLSSSDWFRLGQEEGRGKREEARNRIR